MLRRLLLGSAVAAIALFAPPAKAEILATATHALGIFNTQGLLPIYFNQPYMPFNTSRPQQRIVVRLQSNCEETGWLYLNIQVDGQDTWPLGWSVFCQGHADARTGALIDQAVSQQRTFQVARPGQHNVTVSAFHDGGPWWTLYAMNITVER